MSPISALKNTALSAKIAVCSITMRNTSRDNRKLKLPRPIKRVWALFSIDR